MLAMQTEREGGTGGQVYLLRHGRSETSWDCPVSLSSMLAMQTELGGLASYAFHTVALKSLPSVLLSPASRSHHEPVIHVSHAGRGRGCLATLFTRSL